MSDSVKLERDGKLAVLLLNRPEAMNAVNLELAGQIVTHLRSVSVDSEVRGVVISGQGKAFSAGGDLKWMLGFPEGTAAAIHHLAGTAHQAVLEIRRMRKPVIAAVNGVAAGAGFSVAVACDFRVMSRSAVLQLAYPSAGLCIDLGGTFTLPRIVGLARALEIAAFDPRISSEQAFEWGLVNKVVEDGQALDEGIKMARELADRSLSSFGWCKQLITDSFDTPFETHLERERQGIRSCATHRDGQEGIRAFVEKRRPVFNVE